MTGVPNQTRTEGEIREALKWPNECTEGVTRAGEFQPCEKPAVALRLDPEAGTPYAVCARHARADMVPLASLAASLVAAEARAEKLNEQIENHDDMRLARYSTAERDKARAERDEAQARVEELQKRIDDAVHRLRHTAGRAADYTAEGVAIRIIADADSLAAALHLNEED